MNGTLRGVVCACAGGVLLVIIACIGAWVTDPDRKREFLREWGDEHYTVEMRAREVIATSRHRRDAVPEWNIARRIYERRRHKRLVKKVTDQVEHDRRYRRSAKSK